MKTKILVTEKSIFWEILAPDSNATHSQQGVANLLGPPFAGWLYDASHQWYLTFGIGGANIILSGLLLLIIPLAKMINQSFCCTSSTSKKSPKKSAAIAV